MIFQAKKIFSSLATMGLDTRGFSVRSLSTNSKILVSISDSSYIDTIITFLSEQPEVHFVEPVPKLKLMNHFSAAVTQSGSSDIVNNDGSETPFWKAGLNGAGQIIGVGDTGSCLY
jgi:hypothetical protein